ncbi:MAG: hypothetical protein IPM56_02055 [Ignavibacteriales bacterium]|nr:MAG: hypothetical protein IPM56_02055 [Ignavibacteriales bacterium]
MKAYLSAILVPCLLYFFTGCYTHTAVSKEEFINEYSGHPLQVLTTNHNVYSFEPKNYVVKDDSIRGSGYQVFSEQMKVPFNGIIALSDVEIFNVKKTDGSKSLLTFLGVTAGIFVLIFLIAWISFSDSDMEIFRMPN